MVMIAKGIKNAPFGTIVLCPKIMRLPPVFNQSKADSNATSLEILHSGPEVNLLMTHEDLPTKRYMSQRKDAAIQLGILMAFLLLAVVAVRYDVTEFGRSYRDSSRLALAAAFFSLFAPYLVWQLLRKPRVIISLSADGLLDTRISKTPIDWKRVHRVDFAPSRSTRRYREPIRILVDRASNLGQATAAPSASASPDAWETLIIKRPSLTVDAVELYSEIREYRKKFGIGS